MRRTFLLTGLAVVLLAAITASAALLQVEGGTLQVFEFDVTIEVPTQPPTPPPSVPQECLDRGFSASTPIIVLNDYAEQNPYRAKNQSQVIVVATDDDWEIRGGNSGDCIVGGEGDDTIHGGNAKDVILGRGGNDTLYGGNGDDYIDGGPGNDTCDGGHEGNTLVSCEAGASAASIVEGGSETATPGPASVTPAASATPTRTSTPTRTPTVTPTRTSTPTRAPTRAPSPTVTPQPTSTPVATETSTP